VRFITSDDHAGLRAARQAVFPGAQWQRCQFHLAQNAIHHAPNVTIRKAIGAELRRVWNASTLVSAQEELDRLVKTYQSTAPKLATWLESAVPEGLTVFSLPDQHRRRMRTANPIERAIQQEIKRRTSKVRVFPNEAALLRLVTAILVETRTGQPPIASTSICSTKMTEAPKSEFPEIRLLNPCSGRVFLETGKQWRLGWLMAEFSRTGSSSGGITWLAGRAAACRCGCTASGMG
jgi:transposase-like protein